MEGVVGTGRDQDGPHQDDPVDGVRPRHQRGVQDGRDLGDDFDADEDREDEEGEFVEQIGIHGLEGSSSSFARGWTSSPACVRQLPLMTSSLKSMFARPSLTMVSRRALTFRLKSWLACTGSALARLRGPSMVTPPMTTASPALGPSTFPRLSAAGATITEPAGSLVTLSVLPRTGARRPGIARGGTDTYQADNVC